VLTSKRHQQRQQPRHRQRVGRLPDSLSYEKGAMIKFADVYSKTTVTAYEGIFLFFHGCFM
jgi:hypothetical protein